MYTKCCLLNWLHQQHSAVGASSVVCTLHQACVISVLPVILLYCWNEDKIGDPDRWSIGDLDWWICAMVTFDSIVLLKRQSWSRSVLSCHGDVWFYCIWSCAMVSCNSVVLLKWRQNWWSGAMISWLVFDCSPKEQTGNIKRTERKWRRDLKQRKWVLMLLFAVFMAL